MSYYRGYRRRRYRYSRSARAGPPGRASVARLYGGIDDDVRRLFFALDSFRLKQVFNVYEQQYGDGKRKYAEATLAKWRSGAVQMGGEISERLVRIVPAFLDFEQKYELIEKLWARFRQKATLTVTISPHGGLDAAICAVMDAVEAVGEQEIPSAVADRLDWLAQDDALAAQALLGQIAKREGEIAVQTLEVELRQILAFAWQHQDKDVSATRTVNLPGATVYIRVSQTAPARPRSASMSDEPNRTSDSNPAPLARREGDQSRRDLAPIQNTSDLLGEALRRMSPQKQEEIVGKATDEALRLQVKQKEGHLDHDMASKKVDEASEAAQRLGHSGHDFEYRSEHRSEHGSTQITVKSKRAWNCFVATACYGDCAHPAVLTLRRFRDVCLRRSTWGRAFIAWYYRNSPAFAEFIAQRPILRLAGRLLLWPLVVAASGALCLFRHRPSRT